MPILLRSLIGAIVRWLLAGAFGWLVAKGFLTSEQVDQAVVAIALAVATLGWSFYQKYKDKLKFWTAAQIAPTANPKEAELKVEEIIKQEPASSNIAKAFQ